MKPARQLAAFASALEPADLPHDALDQTRRLLLDLIGVGCRGTLESTARNAAEAMGVPFAWSRLRPEVPPERLALVRGIAAHSIEMDDVTEESSLHPGVVAVPAVLTTAEAGGATGADLLSGVVVAYETICRVGNALGAKAHYARGFHPTATAGVFGAAAGCARVLRLDPDRTLHALGLAGSQAAGLLAYLQNGSEAKRFNAGWAAHGGVIAAQLAAAGVTGPDEIFAGLHGVLAALSDEPGPERVTEGLGSRWEIRDVATKPYASCRHNHAAIDAVLGLRRELDAGDVEEVLVELPTSSLSLVTVPPERKRDPNTEVDAQFSIRFAVACAWIEGTLDFDTLRSRLHDPECVLLAGKVGCRGADDLEARWPREWPARVTATGGGRTIEAAVDAPRGSRARPLTDAELRDRFERFTEPVLDGPAREQLAAAVAQLPDIAPAELLPATDSIRSEVAAVPSHG